MKRAKTETLFVTRLYRTEIADRCALRAELEKACLSIAAEDRAGQSWSAKHGYKGYTSYASLNDLTVRAPPFAALETILDRHVSAFARSLDFDLGNATLALDSLWLNVMEEESFHSGHIHPHSVISGTYYVRVPKAAAAIRFEDPRLPLMMAAPPRRENAALSNRTFVTVSPKSGTLLLWESFVRHEVPRNQARGNRISVSFNYGLR